MERDRPYLPEEVHLLAAAAAEGKKGKRDALLIDVIFAGLKPQQTLSLTPDSIARLPDGKVVFEIEGKGGETKTISCPTELADGLEAYAKSRRLPPTGKLFQISRVQLCNIIRAAGERAGLGKANPSLVYQSGESYRRKRPQHSQDIEDSQCETCKFRLFWRKRFRQ